MNRLNILLVEDDLDDARQIGDMLHRLHGSSLGLVHAATLNDATLYLGPNAFDAVLLDLSLPDSSGLDGLARVQAAQPEIPVIVLTGNDDDEVALRAVGTHAQDYLVKWDFNELVLGRAIRYAVERHRTLLQLAAARDAAEAASRTKSDFLANVSHELRTPMTAIIGMADLLARTPLTPTQVDFVRRLRRASDHLLAMVDDLLDVGAIEAGRIALQPRPIDLQRLVEDTVEFLAVRAQQKGIELRGRVGPGVPVRVVADPRRLRQVLVNLVGNAIKFTERGVVEVAVEQLEEADEAATLRFAVADTGIGIPADKQELIFDRFTQADASITRTHGGSGLGLSIARSLVELMGAELRVRSAPGEGSVFSFIARFELPRLEPAAGAAGAVHVAAAAARPLRILLAEDAEDTQVLVRAFLVGTPHALRTVPDGAVAVEAFQRGRFDVVLMDVHMPVMDGLTATRRMREWERERGLDRTPIVALTADALPESLARCLEAGCDAHLTKPTTRELLVATLEAQAGRQDGAGRDPAIVVEVDRQLLPLMPRFIGNRLEDVARIRAAVASGDFGTIWTVGHNMKGSAAGYRANAVGRLGAELADAATARDEAAVVRLAGELESLLGRLEVVCTENA